jgi:hypothetical protein
MPTRAPPPYFCDTKLGQVSVQAGHLRQRSAAPLMDL